MNQEMIAYKAAMMVQGIDDSLVRMVAKQIIDGQAEALVDMMSDFPEETKTFEDVESAMESTIDATVHYIDEMIMDFKAALIEQVKKCKVETMSASFSKKGCTDVSYKIVHEED